MRKLFRPVLLSAMLGLLEAMRHLDQREAGRPALRWVLRVPLDSPLSHPERCWFWEWSLLAN